MQDGLAAIVDLPAQRIACGAIVTETARIVGSACGSACGSPYVRCVCAHTRALMVSPGRQGYISKAFLSASRFSSKTTDGADGVRSEPNMSGDR
jgi:hypothetical protein